MKHENQNIRTMERISGEKEEELSVGWKEDKKFQIQDEQKFKSIDIRFPLKYSHSLWLQSDEFPSASSQNMNTVESPPHPKLYVFEQNNRRKIRPKKKRNRIRLENEK